VGRRGAGRAALHQRPRRGAGLDRRAGQRPVPADAVREVLRLPGPAALRVRGHADARGPGDAAAAGPDAGVRGGPVGPRPAY
jgi:hypothetical protein